MKTVLVVCHANTARSVMAHVLLERMLARHGVDGAIRVRSGGIANYAREGAGPYLPMHAYLQSADFREHRPHLVIWEIPERALLMSRRTAATAETP